MKKILIVIIFITLPVFVHAQLSGSGTYADPWSGTLAGDATWSGTKYINGDITVDNEKLTISAGAIIVFLAEGADLIITGTGNLDASGTSGNKITLTADDDNDGNYGESNERWGHIYFNAPNESNQSKIDYCIIEYGDVHTFSDYQGYGGAIHSKFSNLIVSNSLFRNNYGDWGGAIFIGASKNPTIMNCLFYNNKSDHAGGGVYCWNNSSSVIENCIFDSNQCLETSVSYYTGGGIAAQTGCSIKVVNCTFANNTSTRTEGQSLLLHSSGNSRVINSIFWGASSKQIYCYNTSASIIINCAYRGITYTSGTPVNPVVLNATNDAADGPNFTNPAGSDWSIKYVSPCRDAGVNSYTGVTIPSTDYIGNPTVYTKDIGAYEFQYSRWKTTASSTDWTTAANWDGGVPTSSRDVVIPAGATNYPTGSTTQDFTLGSDKFMLLEPGARLTLDDLTNNGTLKMNASSSGFSSMIINSYTQGTGATEEIQLFLAGGGNEDDDNFKWHYISTPVSSLAASTFAPVATPDLAQYIESRPLFSLLEGWVAYDGYVYSTGLMDGPTFNTLTPGTGYDFFDYSDHLFTFSGTFNTSDAAMNLAYSGTPYFHGFNLLGNPFSSGLDWNDIANSVYFTYPANTSKGVYFTRDNVQCTYIGGVGIPGDVTGIIPPMQGFFTKTYSTGNMITLPAAARTNAGIHATYKGSTIIPLIRFTLSDDAVKYDETVVRFNSEAKTSLDYDFDAIKMLFSTSKNLIYSSLEGIKYAINGVPYPDPPTIENADTVVEVPIVVNIAKAGNYKISVIQCQALGNYDIALEDKTAGITLDLKKTKVLSFSSDTGTFTDRFVFKMGDIWTGIKDITSLSGYFNIYQYDNSINIIPLNDEWYGKTVSINVIDITGRFVGNYKNIEFNKNSITQLQSPAVRGIYIVEIRSGVKRYAGKVLIN